MENKRTAINPARVSLKAARQQVQNETHYQTHCYGKQCIVSPPNKNQVGEKLSPLDLTVNFSWVNKNGPFQYIFPDNHPKQGETSVRYLF